MEDKHLTLRWVFILVINMILPISACTNEAEHISVQNLFMDKQMLELVEGESYILSVTKYPSNADENIVWVSSNPSIAIVEAGVVTAIKPGVSWVSARAESTGKSASCKITVTEDKGEVFMILSSVTALTATFVGNVIDPLDDISSCKVILYYSKDEDFDISNAESVTSSLNGKQNFNLFLSNLSYKTKYYYRMVTEVESEIRYSEEGEFITDDINVELSAVDSVLITTSYSKMLFQGNIRGLSHEDKDLIEVGLAYSGGKIDGSYTTNYWYKIPADYISPSGSFEISSNGLNINERYYYYSYYVKVNDEYIYGYPKQLQVWHPYNYSPDIELDSAIDLSLMESANCYIVSNPGLYKFKAVKGCSSESVGQVSSCTILWETFGTDIKPECGDLIGGGVSYKDGYIAFKTSDNYKEGNVVIAAKDAEGKILWSWHIWMTDLPMGQVYWRNAGTMMDRNLGALSATPGDPGTLGLIYQWGRKDPFMGEIKYCRGETVSTLNQWPKNVGSNMSTGTIEYSIENPTTYIEGNKHNQDWHYTGSKEVDNTRWTTSENDKSKYDPCPGGWRVPDGDRTGVWAKAVGRWGGWDIGYSYYDEINIGMNFSRLFGNDDVIWYPFTACRQHLWNDILYPQVSYWSATPFINSYPGAVIEFDYAGNFAAGNYGAFRSAGLPVRCIEE